ncbi:MAG: tetratricopeptide repeat protein, partial [Burkholderiales bacterium]|nr:tetratricopeptide repeat protein [Burkholderiales bacterium]
MTGSTGSGESIDSLLDAAADAITRGELTAAYEAARRAAGIAPEAPRVWLTVGAVLHAGGRLDDALDTFVRAHGLAPDDPDIASARAAVLMELGRPEEARAVLQIARDAHPGHARLAVNLAYACEACGDPDAALALLDAVLARLSSGADPARRAALKSRTALYLALRRTPEAWRDANTLVELQPDDADAQFNLAEAALAAGEPEAALAAANHALERRPAHVYAAIDRALALAVLGDFDAASDALDAARAIDPERFDAYRNADRPMVAGTLRDADPMRIWFEAAYERAFVCDWRRSAGFEERLAALVDAGAGQPLFRQESVPFRVLALDWPPTRHAAIARAAAAGVAARAEALPRMEAVPREDRSRIRIGYVSADFREHPMAWLTRHL